MYYMYTYTVNTIIGPFQFVYEQIHCNAKIPVLYKFISI